MARRAAGKKGRATWAWLLWPALGLALLLSQWARLRYPFTDNEGCLAHMARQWAFGRGLYADVWSNKPPLFFLPAYLLQQAFTLNETTLHLYSLSLHALDALALFALARRWGWGPGAWVTAFAYAALIVPPLFLPWSAESDLMMQPFLLWAFWAAQGKTPGGAWLAGLLWGLAFLTKQSAVFFLPAGLAALGWKEWPRLLRAGGGAASALALGMGPFFLKGEGLLALRDMIGSNSGYAPGGWRFLLHAPWYRGFLARWLGWVAAVYGGFFAVFLWNWRKARRGDPLPLLALWALGALAAACASGYFFSYYFIS
ncbi:MAG TPA: glycosyltransferase family 39 protein, partial [bacterium]|nr:glycosyltransferase family 39 protein [bacterium]